MTTEGSESRSTPKKAAPVVSQTSTTTTEASVTTQASPASGKHDLKWGETLNYKTVQVTVSAPQVDWDSEWATAGWWLWYCWVTIRNISQNINDTFAYDTYDFRLFDTEQLDRRALGHSTQPDLGSGQLAAGETVKGVVAYEIPAISSPAAMEFSPEDSGEQFYWSN